MSEDENKRIKASDENTMIKVLGAYDDLFKYYDNVNMITVENFVEEASDFQGSGLNATE